MPAKECPIALARSPRRLAAVAALSTALAGLSALAAAPARAAGPAAPHASVTVSPHDHVLNDSRGQVFTLRVTAARGSSPVTRVVVGRPASTWQLRQCASAPRGWRSAGTTTTCTWTTAGRGLTAGHTGTFRVRAATLPGIHDRVGRWGVSVGGASLRRAGGDLGVVAHALEVTQLGLVTGSVTPGSACPPLTASAPRGGTATVVVCGKNRSRTTKHPQAGASSLGGNLVARPGGFVTGAVRPGSRVVVLGAWPGTTLSRTGTGSLSATVGSSIRDTSRQATVTGLSTTNSAPTAVDDSFTTLGSRDTLVVDAAHGVLANDRDPEGDALRAEPVQGPAHGTLALRPDGGLSYAPAAGFLGTDSFRYVASDGAASSAPATATITVTDVNHAPSFTGGPDLTVAEDAGPQTEPGWATDLSAGPTAESGQALHFEVTDTSAPSLFAGTPTVGTDGTLRFTPAADANGTALLHVRLRDAGGTAGGGIDVSPSQDVRITVTPVNDPPRFTLAGDQSVFEGGPVDIAGFLTDVRPGPADEAGQATTVSLTTADPSLFSNPPAITPAGDLTFTPAGNTAGSTTVTVTVQDDGGGADTTSKTATISVSTVNDAPTFALLAAPSAAEDSGAQTVTSWVHDISPGPADEQAQVVDLTLSSDHPELFTTAPALTGNGTTRDLTFTPAPDAFGTATLTVVAHDDGGTLGGGHDTSAPVRVTLTIRPVNDVPSFTTGRNLSLLEDPGPQRITGWAGNLSAGPANEAAQHVTVVVTPSDPSAFTTTGQPAVGADGTLTFTLAPDVNGTITFSSVAHDDGGTSDRGVDTSAPQTSTLSVTPVNDPPSATLATGETSPEDAGARTILGYASAIKAGGPDEAGQHVTFTVTTTSAGLFTTAGQPAIAPDGTLTYTARPDLNGVATLSITLHDDGGTANGGVDTSTPVSRTITVAPVNDAPSFTKGADLTVAEDSGTSTTQGWATAISAGPPNEQQAVTFDVTVPSGAALFGTAPVVLGNGTLTFTPAPDAFGVATVSVRAHDDGGTSNAGVDVSPWQTFTITISGVNDAPSFTKGTDRTVLEDAGTVTIASWAANITAGPGEQAQTVAFEVVGNSNPSLFATLPSVSPTGTLVFAPAHDAVGSATLSLRLTDNGGTANGGADTSAVVSFSLTVSPVNDPPVFTVGPTQTIPYGAGAQSVSAWATGISPGPPDEANQSIAFTVTSDNNPALFSVAPSVSSTGTLTYTPAPGAQGSARLTLIATDDGGTANGGSNSSAAQAFIITVSANNPPPVPAGATTTILEDTPTVLTLSASDGDGEAVSGFRIVSGPATGTLGPLSSPSCDIDLPRTCSVTVTYTPAANAVTGTSFTWTASDPHAAGAAATQNIRITPVNDAPSFTKGADQTVLEDSPAQSIASWATAISPGPSDEAGQTVTFDVVSVSPAGMFAVGPTISSNGTLRYTPAADAAGVATVTVRAHDDGGTANGGVDVSPTQTFTISLTQVNDAPSAVIATGVTSLEDAGAQTVTGYASAISAGPANESSQTVSFLVTTSSTLFSTAPAISPTGTLTYTTKPDANGSATITILVKDDGGTLNGGIDTSTAITRTITVTPVNDAPSFTAGTVPTVNEDAAAQTVTAWATAISPGPADEAGQHVTFTVSNDNPGLFAIAPNVDATGTLRYTPAADANGSATLSVVPHDDGGTANGGLDTGTAQTATLTVRAVNDAPSAVIGTGVTSLEDAGAQTVTGYASAISAGPANESSQTVSFLVTTSSTLFSTAPAISPTGTLTYTTKPDANGSATITILVKDDGGTLNGGIDTSTAITRTITVTPVNDAPSFTKGANQSVLEDAAPQTVTGWATSISRGPADESGQVLTFNASATNPALFATQPAISPAGALTYTPAPNANGSSTVTVTLADDGGTFNGGVDTSTAQTFTITVTPVNDAPSATIGTGVTSLEDAGAQTVTGYASAISAGPANESSQTVSFLVTTSSTLFSTAPAISAAGDLTYTTRPDANGSATITIVVTDNGGTLNGGIDTSTAITRTITVTPVNDAPSFTKGANQSVLEDAAAQSVTGWATSISPGPADESGQALTFTATNDNATLFSSPPTVASDGTLTYTPAPNANGTATVTVTLADNGGTANGGIDTSPSQTFTITVTPVNDAPSFTKGANQSVLEDAAAQSVTGWATSISPGPADESGQALTFTATNDNATLFSSPPTVASDGTLTYTPAPNANGTATVTVTLADNGGTANGGIDTSPSQTFTITVTPVNDAPSFTKGANQSVLEDAAAQTVTGWATSISPGPADESGQALTFTATNDNATLFSSPPTVASGGTLTYTPAPNANGTATVTVTLADNGGTANGGIDTSTAQTFTITVTPVNDAPSFTKGVDQSTLATSGPVTVPRWATAISAGPADESGQILTFTTTTDVPALFTSPPAIAADGTLTYTPAGTAGTATVTVTLGDSGGTANGGVDTSPTQTFTITLT